MTEVVTTAPRGYRCSKMSSARRNLLQKSGVSRLSGGEEKDSRYSLSDVLVHMISPLGFIGSENSGGMDAIIDCSVNEVSPFVFYLWKDMVHSVMRYCSAALNLLGCALLKRKKLFSKVAIAFQSSSNIAVSGFWIAVNYTGISCGA